MKRVCLVCFSISMLVSLPGIFNAQSSKSKGQPCTKNPTNKGKYKILSSGFGKELQVDVEIKPHYRNDENYITIAREFRERYCRTKELRITYFESRRQWQILDPFDPEATPLAIYYFGDSADQLGLHIYQATDGKVERRSIDLSGYADLLK